MPNGTGKRTSKLEPRLLRFSVLLVLQLLGSLEPHSANCATLTVRKKEDNGHMYVQRANASGCRIVSPVCGTAITVDSTNILFGSHTDGSSYVRFDAHLYNISPKDLSRLLNPEIRVWPGMTHTDSIELDIDEQERFQIESFEATNVADHDGNFFYISRSQGGSDGDIFTKFVVPVHERLMHQPFSVSFRWSMLPREPDAPTLSGVCAGVYQFLAPAPAAPPAPVVELGKELPKEFGIIAVAHDEICSDPHYCSAEYRSLLTDSSRYDYIDAAQVLAEPRMCEPSCGHDEQGLTVILRVHSRPGLFDRSIAHILASDAVIRRLWVVTNGSPHEEFFRARTVNLKEISEKIEVDYFSTTLEVGYYEGMLRALLTDTPFVAVIDDDMMIGTRFLSIAVHALLTRKYTGLITARGKRCGRHTMCSPHALQDTIYWKDIGQSNGGGGAVDVPFSSYIAHASLFKELWREMPLTWKNGEDISIGASVRSFAKMRVLIIAPGSIPGASGDTLHLQHINATWQSFDPSELFATSAWASAASPQGFVEKHLRPAQLRRLIQHQWWLRGWPTHVTQSMRASRDHFSRAACGGEEGGAEGGGREACMGAMGRAPGDWCMAGKSLLLVATEASARRLSRSDILDLNEYSVILNSYSTRSCSRACHKERVLRELGLEPPRIHQDFIDARLFDLQLAHDFPQVQSYP